MNKFNCRNAPSNQESVREAYKNRVIYLNHVICHHAKCSNKSVKKMRTKKINWMNNKLIN